MKLTLRQQITQFAHVLQTGLLTALNEELGELTEPAVYDLDYAHDQGVERLSARLMLPVVE